MPTLSTKSLDAAYDDDRLSDLDTAIPHRGLEQWKWTDVRRALTKRPDGLTAALTPEFRDDHDVEIVQTDVADAHHLGRLISTFGVDAYAVDIPAGVDGGELTITSLERGNGAIRITLGEGASLHVIEHHKGEPKAFVNVDFEYQLAPGATLTRTVLQDDDASTVRIATARIAMGQGAKLRQHIFATGSALSRFETTITGDHGIDVLANGAYLLDRTRHTDMTTLVDLAAPDALIRQSVKGIATDRAMAVFQGKFLVRRAAQHTDAEMRHDAIMLSDRCEIRSKPELEIYADDVACSHGNTLGQLDESALFYMRQRGIPESEARSLLIDAFVSEVFDDSPMAEDLRAKVHDWLEART